MISFILNSQLIETNQPSGTVLLDFIRDQQNLKGTKEGCREGDCGACLIVLGQLENDSLQYKPINSCLLPLGDIHGCHIVTIEGIDSGKPNPLQQSFVDEGATQCGYCTPGFIMAEMAFLLTSEELNPHKAIAAIDGNICRCTGYQSIIRAVEKTCNNLAYHSEPDVFKSGEESPGLNKTSGFFSKDHHQNDIRTWLIKLGYLPGYFKDIPGRLSEIKPRIINNQNKILVAGGTDLFVQKEPQISNKNIGILLSNNAFKGIKEKNDHIYLGANTTVSDMVESKILQLHFPKIEEFLKLHSSTPIRNRATLGGNIVNASPIGDMTLFLLALDAILILDLKGKKREIPLKKFYTDYKQFDLKKGELVKTISFKTPSANSHFNFEKVSRRTYLDIASVTSAAMIEINDQIISNIHISAGGVAPYPFYLLKTRDFLNGKTITIENIKKAIKLAMKEISPISDMRGSAEYKSLLLRQLIYGHFSVLFPGRVRAEELIITG